MPKPPLRRVRRQVPPEILESPEIRAAVAMLPSNYSFEIEKTIWRVREADARCVALQFPEGLLLYANAIADMIYRFCAPARVVVLADVTYGACCVDDLTAKSLGADFLVHYGHSCLVPSKVTQLPSLYVFVEIGFDVDHLVGCVQAEFSKASGLLLEGERGSTSPDEKVTRKRSIALAGTIQFAGGVTRAAQMLREDASLEVTVPQELPLSAGEVLGCTSPRLDAIAEASGRQAPEAFVFVADGRFHLESLMIRNPAVAAFRYDPYSKVLTRERYDTPKMSALRRAAVDKARTAQSYGVVLGTLGRQGSPDILRRIRQLLVDKKHFVLLVSEISLEKLGLFDAHVDAWIQIACPRLSIDWGHAFSKPLLSPYEAFVALGEEEVWDEKHYPMDFYSKKGGKWTNYHKDEATTLTSSYGSHGAQYVRLRLPPLSATTLNGLGCVVVVHGGFWKSAYSMDNAAVESLAPWLTAKREQAVLEVEYRRLDDEGGGWPGTPQDVLAAVEHLFEKQRSGARGWRRIDPAQIVILGHSAGGHAALYAAHHCSVKPALVVVVAPVADLIMAHERRLSDEGDAVELFMGGGDMAEASPRHSMLPLRAPTLIVSGSADTDVPVDMTETFYHAAKKEAVEQKQAVELLLLQGADHYSLLDAKTEHWAALWSKVEAILEEQEASTTTAKACCSSGLPAASSSSSSCYSSSSS